jgi:hypothetical protein
VSVNMTLLSWYNELTKSRLTAMDAYPHGGVVGCVTARNKVWRHSLTHPRHRPTNSWIFRMGVPPQLLLPGSGHLPWC